MKIHVIKIKLRKLHKYIGFSFSIFILHLTITGILLTYPKLFNVNEAILFPILSSRNKTVALGNKILKNTAKTEFWKKANVNNFYVQYLKILNTVAKELNTNISTIEMLLFAKAEELVETTFKK